MKIHLLSDIHLESGPYQIPANLDCDVIVAAGDIGVGAEGIEWLNTLGKPVVYVLGNHEYWTKKEAPIDMSAVLRHIKDAAAGSNVHVLENEFVIIDGARFFGATFWTNLGRFNTMLIDEAHHMRDYVHIYCKELYEEKNFISRFYQCVERYCALNELPDNSYREHIQAQYIDTGRFHPFVGYLLNQTSWKIIQEKILYDATCSSPAYTQTVVVTHHHPSYQSLRLHGLNEREIHPSGLVLSAGRQPNGRMYKTAAYASDLTFSNFGFNSNRPRIDAWLCGHLHQHMEYAHEGARVICNPRGRHIKPLTEDSAKAFAFFGAPVSAESVQESQKRFEENPFQGDGVEFDADMLIDLHDGITQLLKSEIARHLPDLQRWHMQIQKFADCMEKAEGTAVDALQECIETRVDEFEKCVRTLEKSIQKNTNEVVEFSTIGLSYEKFRRHLLNNEDDSGIQEETKAIITAQENLLQKLALLIVQSKAKQISSGPKRS